MSRFGCLFLLLLIFFGPAASLQAQGTVQQQVQEFLQAQPGFQGQRFRVEWPRDSVRLPTCKAPLVWRIQTDVQAAVWTPLSVRCPVSVGAWERTVQVRVHWWRRYLAATRNLMPGHRISEDDWVWAEGEQHGEDLAQDPGLVLNQELRRPVSKGAPIRLNTLRPVTVIKSGSKVILLLQGPGFEIEAEGQALDSAPLGGTVRVLIKEGTIISAKVTAVGVVQAK